MLRYKLRTLLIVLALGPPLLGYSYLEYERRQAKAEQLEVDRLFSELLYGGKTSATGKYGITVRLLPPDSQP